MTNDPLFKASECTLVPRRPSIENLRPYEWKRDHVVFAWTSLNAHNIVKIILFTHCSCDNVVINNAVMPQSHPYNHGIQIYISFKSHVISTVSWKYMQSDQFIMSEVRFYMDIISLQKDILLNGPNVWVYRLHLCRIGKLPTICWFIIC